MKTPFMINSDFLFSLSLIKGAYHTLPVYYLWPLSTENATLLCHDCNGKKSGTWPSKFYSDAQLRRLSILTGIDYNLLSGEPQYNPKAIEALHDPEIVDSLLTKFAAYMDEVIKLRNRIFIDTGFDFFTVSKTISDAYVQKAYRMLRSSRIETEMSKLMAGKNSKEK